MALRDVLELILVGFNLLLALAFCYAYRQFLLHGHRLHLPEAAPPPDMLPAIDLTNIKFEDFGSKTPETVDAQ